MITIDNVQLRNLEEQVLKNQHDISDIKTANQILNQFGIKVIGQVLDVSQLPNPATYEGEYGDAYLVGKETPFDYYIYTRPNQFHETAFWLNIGEFPLAGPKGDTGETGPKGDTGTGSKWYASLNAPSTTEGINKQDQWLNTSDGNVYEFNGTNWILTGNIRGVQGIQGIQGIQGPIGPQGIQGIQGEKGDVGGFINIAGTVENVNQLPTPASLGNLTMAYLVGTLAPYTLYIQVGSTSDTAVWQNMGALNVATYITVNGQYVNILEMNNYQTKIRFIQLTGTSGQLSQANLTLLQSDYSNYILLDNEKYVLNDIMSSEGYFIYTHTGRDSAQNLNIKTISIMLNNRTWSMVSNGVQKQLSNLDLTNFLFPIGAYYGTDAESLNTVEKMNAHFGGTWEMIKGRSVVGYDPDDTDFNQVGKTGGEKTHTLTVDEMPSHTHPQRSSKPNDNSTTYTVPPLIGKSGWWEEVENGNTFPTGGGQAHNNMGPYVVAYLYHRIG